MSAILPMAIPLLDPLRSALENDDFDGVLTILAKINAIAAERKQDVLWERERKFRPQQGEDKGWEHI